MDKYLSVNGRDFKIEKLLGKGKGGYSYLVSKVENLYVLKQIHHEPCDCYQFNNKLISELRNYGRLKGIGIRMPELIDVDLENERILKEYIEGNIIMDLGCSAG